METVTYQPAWVWAWLSMVMLCCYWVVRNDEE
jgi:hypothetical protein